MAVTSTAVGRPLQQAGRSASQGRIDYQATEPARPIMDRYRIPRPFEPPCTDQGTLQKNLDPQGGEPSWATGTPLVLLALHRCSTVRCKPHRTVVVRTGRQPCATFPSAPSLATPHIAPTNAPYRDGVSRWGGFIPTWEVGSHHVRCGEEPREINTQPIRAATLLANYSGGSALRLRAVGEPVAVGAQQWDAIVWALFALVAANSPWVPIPWVCGGTLSSLPPPVSDGALSSLPPLGGGRSALPLSRLGPRKKIEGNHRPCATTRPEFHSFWRPMGSGSLDPWSSAFFVVKRGANQQRELRGKSKPPCELWIRFLKRNARLRRKCELSLSNRPRYARLGRRGEPASASRGGTAPFCESSAPYHFPRWRRWRGTSPGLLHHIVNEPT